MFRECGFDDSLLNDENLVDLWVLYLLNVVFVLFKGFVSVLCDICKIIKILCFEYLDIERVL